MSKAAQIAALHEFVEAINATGGVVEDGKGNYEPVADRDWLDIGNAYISACRALGLQPTIAKGTEPYDDEPDDSFSDGELPAG